MAPRCSNGGGCAMTSRYGQALAHASHTPAQLPIANSDLPTLATCGRSGSISSDSAALTLSLANKLTTALCGSTECTLTWKERVLPSGRSIFRLAPSMRPKSECAHSLWPTPTVQDSANRAGPSQWVRNSFPLNVQVVAHALETTTRPENLEELGDMAPEFVCWLMGYPVEWVSCGDLAMLSSRNSRRNSSKRQSKQSAD